MIAAAEVVVAILVVVHHPGSMILRRSHDRWARQGNIRAAGVANPFERDSNAAENQR